MEEFVLYQQPYDNRAATAAAQAYMNRWLGISIIEAYVTVDNGVSGFFASQYPIRHAIMIDSTGSDIAIKWDNRRLVRPRDVRWGRGTYTIQYASGYGVVSDPLPAVVDSSFQSALATQHLLPFDIATGIDQLQETLDDRAEQRADVDSMSGQLGSTSFLGSTYRSAIPTQIKGLFYNHRRVVV